MTAPITPDRAAPGGASDDRRRQLSQDCTWNADGTLEVSIENFIRNPLVALPWDADTRRGLLAELTALRAADVPYLLDRLAALEKENAELREKWRQDAENGIIAPVE